MVFYKPNPKIGCLLSESPYIAINTTLDQLSMQNRIIGKIDYGVFKKEFCNLVKCIIEKTEYSIVFVPHIYKDIQAFGEILKDINDFYIRSRIIIAPYIQGDYGCNMLLSVYQNSSYVVGMRFHSNVCPIAMKKPITGLAALDRVVHLYDSIDKSDDVALVSRDFCEKIYCRLSQTDYNYNLDIIDRKRQHSLSIYRSFLTETGVIG